MNEETPQLSRYRFDDFVIDVCDRQLWCGETQIDLNARYFDALVLLVRKNGQLVEKDRFFDEVWKDVVVSDSALTQCIKEIRKALGDDASNPDYIRTVPGHGYRFIGTVEPVAPDRSGADSSPRESRTWRSQAGLFADGWVDGEEEKIWWTHLYEVGAGTLGGGIAGLLGGLFYGFGLASTDAGVGTLSTLLVLVSVSVLLGLTGGFGVSVGLSGGGLAARYLPTMRVALRVTGAGLGGLFVGSFAKLLGVDAFNLLFGRAPAGITGGPEGAVLGAAVTMGAHVGDRCGEWFRGSACWSAPVGAGLLGAAAGALIPLAGGRLLGGSLDLLASSFVESRLQLETFGLLFGELNFGRATQVGLSGIEGLLFGSCVIGALVVMGRFEPGRRRRWRL